MGKIQKAPWIILKGNEKEMARLEGMRYVLSQIDFPCQRDQVKD